MNRRTVESLSARLHREAQEHGRASTHTIPQPRGPVLRCRACGGWLAAELRHVDDRRYCGCRNGRVCPTCAELVCISCGHTELLPGVAR